MGTKVYMVEKFQSTNYINESPIDYVKAIKHINENPHNGLVMKTIYQNTRQYIPDTVYKYYSLSNDKKENDIKFKTLGDKQVYMAQPTSFNDPFDNNAFYYKKEKLMKYEFLARFNGKFIDDFSNYVRLSAFTDIGINSMPMWAHYSNNHQGYCVAYDTKLKDNLNLRSGLFPIQYIEERIDITSILKSVIEELIILKDKAKMIGEKKIISDNLIIIWISIYYACLKHKSWSYEKELRCVAAANSPGMPYINAIPSKIYIGASCSDINIKHLVDIASQLNIPIYTMEMIDYNTNYELTPKRLL